MSTLGSRGARDAGPRIAELRLTRDGWRVTKVELLLGDEELDITMITRRVEVTYDAADGPGLRLDVFARAVIEDRSTPEAET